MRDHPNKIRNEKDTLKLILQKYKRLLGTTTTMYWQIRKFTINK
jgi:hypothetical protein